MSIFSYINTSGNCMVFCSRNTFLWSHYFSCYLFTVYVKYYEYRYVGIIDYTIFYR